MTSTPAVSPAVESALTNMPQLATLPEISARILDVVNDDNATAQDLEKLVSRDLVLSAQVLKVANSPFYGLRASVGSRQQP